MGRRYSGRAATVIAMFDRDYSRGPDEPEQRIEGTLVLRPAAAQKPFRSHSPGCQLKTLQPDARQESPQPPDQAEADVTTPPRASNPSNAFEMPIQFR